MEIETKNIEVNDAGVDEQGIFTGHASVFGIVDSDNDVVEPGAFADTIKDGLASEGVLIFGQHEDGHPPIGKSIVLREDREGLYIRGLISPTLEGMTYRQLIKDKVLNKMSIGYIPVEYFVDDQGIRHLTRIELLEVSVVNYPANTGANIDSYKGGKKIVNATNKTGKKSTPPDETGKKSDPAMQSDQETVTMTAEELTQLLEDTAEAAADKALQKFTNPIEDPAAEEEQESKEATDEEAKDPAEAHKSKTLQYQRKGSQPQQAAQRKYADIYMNTGAQPEKKSTQLPKGHAWVKYQKAMSRAHGDYERAAYIMRKELGAAHLEKEVKAFGQSATAPSDGGFLVPEDYASEVIELLRDRAILMKLGATVIDMPHGNINIPKMTQGSSAGYVGELRKAQASKAKVGNLKLTSKKLMTKMVISNDLINSNAYSADQMVLNDAVATMANAMDKAGLQGKGTEFEPKGILNMKGITRVTVNANPGTTTSGAILAKLLQKNADTNNPSMGWAFNAFAWEQWYNVVDATSGLFVYRQQMDEGKLNGYRFEMSNQIANAEDANASTTAILGVWSDFLIGRQGQMESRFYDQATIEVDGEMVSAADNDGVILICKDLHDFGVRHEESFVIAEGIYTK